MLESMLYLSLLYIIHTYIHSYIPSMQKELLKFFLLFILKCTVDHGQQYIVNYVQHNDQKDNKKYWCQFITLVALHHDIRKTR